MIFADWCVLVALFLPWLCAGYGKWQGGFSARDNRDTRGFFARAEGVAARANAAQQNSFEILPAFIFVVLLAQFSGNAATATINLFAALFVLSRAIYIWCYITDRAKWRSLSWGLGLLFILILFGAAI
ncbi:MAPEG family protein [Suttonella sp. R2A3]|uniref:MAPEG family protein n=1 Tax=Suttonella sp. R2A3 TaxID=2908648 RepID=UPI001F389CA3|nr:MAPEG family protein [Suttonella sp. R2A3]UJF24327.1 MAPEG family protein [Suttonella sp. R2A3]